MEEEHISEREELQKSLIELDSKLESKLISQEEYDNFRSRILRLIKLIEDRLEKERPKSPQEGRRGLYENDFVRSILSRALDQGGRLEPVYKSGEGFVYLINGELRPEEVLESPLIQRMIELDILDKELYKKQPTCPKCRSASLFFQSDCPKCQSQNIETKKLIEHYRCGYIAPEAEFLRGTEMSCPKCNKKLNLVGKDYRRLGVQMKCLECGELFSLPHQHLTCMNCKEIIEIGEESNIRWQPLHTYEVNQSLISEISGFIASVAPIVKILEGEGWLVMSPGKIKGESGISHQFRIVASKNERVITLELASQVSKIDATPIIALFAKNMDAKVDDSFFVAIPSLEENALKLAGYYRIRVVEGRNMEEAASKFERMIS